MMLWVSVYAVVYAIFINPVYSVLQLFVVLAIPLLKMCNDIADRRCLYKTNLDC